MKSVVFCRENGVVAMMLEEDFQLLQRCKTSEEALECGVRWYVFAGFPHTRSDIVSQYGVDFLGTIADFDFYVHESGLVAREDNFFVPFAAGPLSYDHDRKFASSLVELTFRLAGQAA